MPTSSPPSCASSARAWSGAQRSPATLPSFGDVGRDPKKKTYRAILAFDQPLGFSTAISMDVLSKDQRRGLTKFQLLQIGVTHPIADRGRITAGTALFLNGNNPMNIMNPEWNLGFRLYLPFDWP